jgi:hypothetical protein
MHVIRCGVTPYYTLPGGGVITPGSRNYVPERQRPTEVGTLVVVQVG